MSIIEKYQQFLAELKANPKIEFNEDFTNENLREPSGRLLKSFQNDLKDEVGVEISDEDLIYFKFAGVSILWDSELRNVDIVMSGGFEINGITDALTFSSTFWKGAFSLPPDRKVPEELKHFEKLGWFEHQAWEDGRYGCFIKQAGIFPPPLAFYNLGWYVKLEMNLEDYFTKMFGMYAVRGWQFFYIDVTADIPKLDDVLRDMRIASEQLPLLFPEKDWTFQIEKYNADLKRLKK